MVQENRASLAHDRSATIAFVAKLYRDSAFQPLDSRRYRSEIGAMTPEKAGYSGAERRSNPRLRELIDEMLASIRAAHRIDLWTDEERQRYEQELGRIMDTVRGEALLRSRTSNRAQLS